MQFREVALSVPKVLYFFLRIYCTSFLFLWCQILKSTIAFFNSVKHHHHPFYHQLQIVRNQTLLSGDCRGSSSIDKEFMDPKNDISGAKYSWKKTQKVTKYFVWSGKKYTRVITHQTQLYYMYVWVVARLLEMQKSTFFEFFFITLLAPSVLLRSKFFQKILILAVDLSNCTFLQISFVKSDFTNFLHFFAILKHCDCLTRVYFFQISVRR